MASPVPRERSQAEAAGTCPDPDDGSPDKLATQIARQIEAEVIRREWPVGELLHSEPDLRDRYQVSRTVLREAVRLVEYHKVARMRRGPRGGLIVTAPDTGPAIWAIASYLEFVGVRVADIVRMRTLLEPVAAGLAAERITEDGIRALRAVYDNELRHGEGLGSWEDDRLHALLSELSGNPVLELFVDVLDSLTRRYVQVAEQIDRAEIGRTSRNAHKLHTRIVDAVVAGNAADAEVGVRDHLDELTDWLRGLEVLGRPRLGRSSTATQLGASTLAVAVAARIYDDITASGWPVGASLGSESELTSRYGVSRAVLRASVRLLEHHSIASPRRGRIGGLVVTEPARQSSADSAALYLAYRGATADHLRTVREVIELGAVADVVGAGRHAGPNGDQFHLGFAEATGNPVLSLFLSIVADVAARVGTGVVAAAAADLEVEHVGVIEAVEARDTSLAQHRLRRHLDASPGCWG
jgi:DNA-binding FadR family transcriptional regulator